MSVVVSTHGGNFELAALRSGAGIVERAYGLVCHFSTALASMYSITSFLHELVDALLHDIVDIEMCVFVHFLNQVRCHWIAHQAQAYPPNALR